VITPGTAAVLEAKAAAKHGKKKVRHWSENSKGGLLRALKRRAPQPG
jgi:hypothetical protein